MTGQYGRTVVGTSLVLGAMVLALLVGYGLGKTTGPSTLTLLETPGEPQAAPQVWTCSMHPHVRLHAPGLCPICAMQLVPAASESSRSAGPTLTLSEHARAMAGVETVAVEPRHLERDIRVTSKIHYNETTLATVTSRVDGYVERLYVDSTGLTVEPGVPLLELYSPELAVAQRELLLAQEMPGGATLLKASKHKLRQWDMTEKQIEALLATRTIREHLTVVAPVHGTVVEKLVVTKSAVRAGDVLYRLADLRSVWATLDIYEHEIGLIQYGQQVSMQTEAYPGDVFTGRIALISPVLDEATRTIRARVHLDNPQQRLKPGMFMQAHIHVPLLSDGQAAPTGVEGQYTCPLHPEIVHKEPGQCPRCGMDLRRIPGAAVRQVPGTAAGVRSPTPLAVPVTAVLDSGTRTLVYVEKARGEFASVVVTLGPRAGDFYPVLAGLHPGERVAVRGTFLLDSQFQIRGLPSVLSPGGREGADGRTPKVTPARERPTVPRPGAPTTASPPHSH